MAKLASQQKLIWIKDRIGRLGSIQTSRQFSNWWRNDDEHAALSLFEGILLLWHPVEGTVSLTLVLISFFIAVGIFQIAAAARCREAFPDS